MNLISRTITGLIIIVVGLMVIGISFFMSFAILIYGLPILIIGIVILLNKSEDKIEQIKKIKGRKKKK